jgi:hypothetical protein
VSNSEAMSLHLKANMQTSMVSCTNPGPNETIPIAEDCVFACICNVSFLQQGPQLGGDGLVLGGLEAYEVEVERFLEELCMHSRMPIERHERARARHVASGGSTTGAVWPDILRGRGHIKLGSCRSIRCRTWSGRCFEIERRHVVVAISCTAGEPNGVCRRA